MRTPAGVIFDLDGVITDTAELHFQSWLELCAELGLAFDRAANEALRGLGRMESLRIVLGPGWDARDEAGRLRLAARKNELYLARVAGLGPADLLPGIEPLLRELRAAGVRTAVASSSRNARPVLAQLGVAGLFDAIVDGNDAPRSKPDPQVFARAAAALGLPPAQCVAIEDAAAGVAAARAAGMRVVGIGPPQRVGAADLCLPDTAALRSAAVLALAAAPE